MVETVEPDNIFLPANLPENISSVCFSLFDRPNNGIFYSSNSFNFTYPLLLFQMSLSITAIYLTFYLLRPLRQPVMLAQILGGILVGPSLLCRIPGLLPTIFPFKSFVLMDMVSALGNMFYFFLVGVQTDLMMLKKITKKTFAIGFFSVAVPMVLTMGISLLIPSFDPNAKKTERLPVIAEAESVLSFPIIAYYLAELRIINSDFGRVALCSSMVSTLCSFIIITTNLLWHQSGEALIKFLVLLGNGLMFVFLIIFILTPLILWERRQNLIGQPSKQGNMIVLFLAMLMSGFFGHCFGLHYVFGPLVCGLIIPSGPPLGSLLVEKLHIVTYWMLMPIYFVKYGLAIDIFSIDFSTYSRVQFIALLGASGKFLGASLSALSCRMPPRDAVSLGIVMTFQGIVELAFFKLMNTRQVIDDDSFTAMCVSFLITTIVTTPIIRHFCNPLRRYAVYRGRTVMDAKSDSELRVLVCAYDEENVPSAINVLRALNPCKQSPIAVYMLHLIELTGSATPVLIPQKKTKRLSSRTSSSGPVINAFKNLEENHGDYVSIFPFIAISPPQTMHDDVCTIALDKGISLIIMPFYKRFYNYGALHSSKQAFKFANQNVLDHAPCSVALLVDRGNITSVSAIWTSLSSYEVAIVFLGGPDDREALTLGIRMAGRPNINVTLIRIFYNGYFPDTYTEGWRFNHELLLEFQTEISENYYAKYIEEPVMDGAGTASVLRTLENQYELVVVGRRHDAQSPMLSGLVEWNENSELGIIGDVLASSDFLGNTTILVVQQHADAEYGHVY